MIQYLGLVILGFVGALLFRARGIVGFILSEAKIQIGDYDGALRLIRRSSLGIPNAMILHKEGLILAQAGRPAEAEARLRKALAKLRSDSNYPKERLYSALGYALIELGRYDEAERCFLDAIEAGDVTGTSQNGLAELRVVQGVEAGQALAYSGQAIELAKQSPDGSVPVVMYANQAWALALLGRGEEARQSLGEALRVPPTILSAIASLHWRIGMVLVAMQQPGEAREYFQIGCDTDPRGTFGRRCAEQLHRAE